MTPYRHTQFSLLNILTIGLPAVICLFVFFTVNIAGGFSYLTLGLGVFFLALAYCFHSLTIEVDADEIRMSFGPGLIKKSWAVSTCTSARTIRTRLIDGWGIRLTKDGWLYNVSIPHAVLIRLVNGKAVQLGSDEPEQLLAALREAGLELETT
jgi:hypothetical protein